MWLLFYISLGNSKKPEMVQPHMKKLFDNINKIKLSKGMFSNKYEASGMFSGDGEYIEFSNVTICDGPVERWLCEIEKNMRITLHNEIKVTRAALRKMLSKRDKWIKGSFCNFQSRRESFNLLAFTWLEYLKRNAFELKIWGFVNGNLFAEQPGQLCITSSQIQWTTDCTRTLHHCKMLESKTPLRKLRTKQNKVLQKFSEAIRGNLSKVQRLKVVALVTIEIHARDVIDKMYKVPFN